MDDERLLDTSENGEDQLRGEDTAKADTQDTESQKDLELAEREQQLPLEIQEKRNRGALRTGFYDWNFSDRCD